MRERSAMLIALAAVIGYATLFVIAPARYWNVDALIQYRWHLQYVEAWQGGMSFPRWAWADNAELGAPVFLYYPSLFYLFALPLALLPLPPMAQTDLAVALAGVLLVAAVALTQRRALGPAAWLLGAAVLWSPASFFVQGRVHAYPWYLSLVPTFLFVHFSLRQLAERRSVAPGVGLSYALVAMTHPLSGFMVALVVPIAWLRHVLREGFERKLILSAVGWGVQVLLGAGLAAVYLLPALTSWALINSDGWAAGGGILWHQQFALHPDRANAYWWPLLWVMPLPVYALALGLAGLLALRRLRTAPAADPRVQAGLDWFWVAVPCLLLAMYPAIWIWEALPPLQHIQRPYRFLPIAAAALLVAAFHLWPVASRLARLGLAAAFAAMLASTAMQHSFTLHANPFAIPPERLRELFYVHEYLPTARGPEWRTKAMERGFAADCARQGLACARGIEDGALFFRIEGAAGGRVRLPLFDFPAWRLTVNGAPQAIARDAPTGVIVVEMPAGTHRIEARWARLPVERNGALISLVAAALMVLLWFAARRMPRRG